MLIEKDMLKNDLSKLEDKEAIENLKEDAALLGYEDIVILAQEKIQSITEESQSISSTSPEELAGIVSAGGNSEEILLRTAEIDNEIDRVKIDAEKQISSLEATQESDPGIQLTDNTEKQSNEQNESLDDRPYKEGILKASLEIATESPSFEEFKKVVKALDDIAQERAGESFFGKNLGEDAEIAKTSFLFTFGNESEKVNHIDSSTEDEIIKRTKKGGFDLMHGSKIKGLVKQFNDLAPKIYEAYKIAHEKLAKEVDDFEKSKSLTTNK